MDLLGQQRALLAALPARVARELSADDRIAAVWLGGSLGRGDGDALSDIDLVIVCRPDGVLDVASSVVDRLEIAGPVALVHEAPQNAPVEGRQLNVLYDTMPIPVYVDWNIWPVVPVRPRDVSVLFEREPLERSDLTFHETLDKTPLGRGFDQTPDVVDRFRVFMTPILAKYAARRRFDAMDPILGYMNISEDRPTTVDAAIALAKRILDDAGRLASDVALTCIRRYLGLAQTYKMPGVANDLHVLMALRVQGIGSSERVAAATGDDPADVSAKLAELAAAGNAAERTGRVAGFTLTPQGIERLDSLLGAEGLRTNDDLKDCYELFLTINNRVLKVSSDWQMRDDVPNDHSDTSYDDSVIDRLSELNDSVRACMRKMSACAPRFSTYGARLDSCVERLLAGDRSAFTAPLAESFHTVWFELHQDLLLTLGLERET